MKTALGQFRHHPTFALVTVLVLGLGTAAASTVFTIVDSVVLTPLPYGEPDRLVTIWDTNADQARSRDRISPVNFMDQRALPVFADAAAWWRPAVNLADPGLDPIRVNTVETSGNLFEVLRVQPQLGPGFPERGPLFVQNELVILISDRLWRSRYGGDSSIIGRPLVLNDMPYTVVGVMPPGFHYPDDIDVWQRLRWDLTRHSRQAHFMEAVARLSNETTVEQAQSAIDGLWTRLETEFGNSRSSPGKGWGSRLVPLLDQQLGYYRPALMVLAGAVGLLLLIGVLNVACLQLTRALSRDREMAIRVAMGCSPRQLVAQLMAESLILAAAGAAVGLAAAAAAVALIVRFSPVEIPRLAEAAVDLRTLGLAVAVVGASAIVFGLVPSLLLAGGRLTRGLSAGERGSSRGARRAYSVLVAAEVALACTLLVCSALLVRTVGHMMDTPLGVNADNVMTTAVQVLRPAGPTDAASVRNQWLAIGSAHTAIVEAVRAQPGVVSAGASNFLPLEIGWRNPFQVEGQAVPVRPDDAAQAQFHSVSEGYFETMGAQLLAGRNFTAFDGPDSAAVVVVNDAFARRYLDGQGVGRQVRLFATGIGPLGVNLKARAARNPEGLPYDVIGVVVDIRNVPLGQTVEPAIYTSTRQFPFSEVIVAVRAVDNASAVSAVRAALRAVAPEVPMGPALTWGQRFATRTAEPRLLMSVLLFFAGLAAILAALGVYGLLSWAVALRTRELAIRMTLGARPARVGTLIVRQSAGLVAAGLAAGLLIVWGVEGAIERVLYAVTPRDPLSTAAAVAVLVAAALIACIPPALRAMRVDPVEGLRVE